MKVISLLLFSVIAACAGELKWNDEFNGDSLDLTKWSYELGKRHDAINCKESIIVSDGELKIKVFTRNGEHFTGIITTKGKFEAAYGYWEIKAKFNSQAGTWSDAWLYTDSALNCCDIHEHGVEIDIFEHRLFNPHYENISQYIVAGVHWDGYGEEHKNVATKIEIGYPDEYHIFGFKWTKDSYQLFIDGKLVLTMDAPITSKPLFFLLSTEVGYLHYWTAPLLEEYDHITMTVDWVRYYSLE